MPFLPTSNNLSTNLTVLVLVGDTTIDVVDTTGFVAPGVVSIESEVIHYTGLTGTSFTGCTRGYDGTTAAAHSLNDVFGNARRVSLRVISKHVQELQEELDGLLEGGTIAYSDPSPQDLFVVDAEHMLVELYLDVLTAFDDPAATIQLGTAGTPDLYIGPVCDLDVVALYKQLLNEPGPITVRMTLSPGASTAGSVFIGAKKLRI
jgi:hypothetical protein